MPYDYERGAGRIIGKTPIILQSQDTQNRTGLGGHTLSHSLTVTENIRVTYLALTISILRNSGPADFTNVVCVLKRNDEEIDRLNWGSFTMRDVLDAGIGTFYSYSESREIDTLIEGDKIEISITYEPATGNTDRDTTFNIFIIGNPI